VLFLAVLWQGRVGELRSLFLQHPREPLLLGLLNPLAYYGILLTAYDLLPAQQAQTINYTWAVMLALLSIPVLGQRLDFKDWAAVFFGYLGVVIIATEGRPWTLDFSSPVGVALAVTSTLLWAVFWLLNTRSRTEPAVQLTGCFLVAAPVSVAICFLSPAGLPTRADGMAAALYVGLFEMGITWLMWSTALRAATNVSRVGNLIFLAPLLSLFFISQVLGEAIHPATLVGLALILPGIVVQQRSNAQRAGR
jgi:drug/metabolite transporter (DMT)-like permease